MSKHNPGISNHPPAVWLITDNKPGHRNQLAGLGRRLEDLAGASLHWLDANTIAVPAWKALLGIAPSVPADLPAPRLIIAAGTGTHRLLLSLRRIPGARTAVLMKPSFPLALVDAAIIPRHDGKQETDRLLLTEGAINTITPGKRQPDARKGVILVGGPSKHYRWDNDSVLAQIQELIREYPEWEWVISSSRRTPPELSERLEGLKSGNVDFVTPEQTPAGWLEQQFRSAGASWVTPDSVSMVFESITSGVPTGIFSLEATPGSRVARGVAHLQKKRLAGFWPDHASVMRAQQQSTPPLWEADRAARWLLPLIGQTR